MNSTNTFEIPVTCTLCGTRVHVPSERIGKTYRCPDCHSINEVKAPVKEVKKGPQLDDDEGYSLAEGVDQPAQKQVDRISVICTTCHELLHAQAGDVGKKIKCPVCSSLTTVPRPRVKKDHFQVPDVSDMTLDDETSLENAQTKNLADQMMDAARQAVAEREAEEDQPPKRPFVEGVVNYPIYPEIIPIWIGIGIAVMGIVVLIWMISALMATGSLMMVGAAFVSCVLSVCFLGFNMMFCPALLYIIENASVARDRIHDWPRSDIFDRFYSFLFVTFAIVFSSLPGMSVALALSSLGVPYAMGMLGTVITFPLVMLSMLESNSMFGVISAAIWRSLSVTFASWVQFWIATALLIGGAVGIGWGIWRFNPMASIVVGALVGGIVMVVYCRLLGRLAWVVMSQVNELPDESDE